MQEMSRRRLLTGAMAGSATLLAARQARAADARVEVLLNEPIGAISPDLYGHFTEHIGGVIYDGVWVGERSRIPNYGGVRAALVDKLKLLKPSVIRWPGGCFADSYDWRDGIGPRDRRPRRTNFWVNDMRNAPDGPQKYDSNQFGTNEFNHFCRLVGAQPYLAANVRSLTAKDFYQWVEYCNAPAGLTTLSDARAAAGSREPFNVRYWGIGNESWGCGGNFSPEDYAVEFRRWTAWAPGYGVKLAYIGSGPNGGDLKWTRGFFHKLTEQGKGALHDLYGWALHYYCGTSGKGQAVDFTEADWYDLLAKAGVMDSLIKQHWDAMGEVDTERRVKLIVDEWGAWHHAGTEVAPAFLFGQMPTMRDALISAITLDIFNRHADKIAMANVAQLINNIHTLFLAHEDRFTVTPNYHVFEMYSAHHRGKSLRTAFSTPDAAAGRGLVGSASMQGKQLVLTAANPHVSEPCTAEIVTPGARIAAGEATTLSGPDIHAHNTFREPNAVEPKNAPVTPGKAGLVYSFPPASVTRLRLTLA